jgi:transcriptional regulator with XRE-family HTH domain
MHEEQFSSLSCNGLPPLGLRCNNARMPWFSKLSRAIGSTNLTQKAFSVRVGRSESAVSRWCAGKSKPDFDELLSILEITGVSADWLLIDEVPELPIRWREPQARPSGVARVTDAVDQTEHITRLNREAKSHKKRPKRPGGEAGPKVGDQRGPRPGGGKGQDQLRTGAVRKDEPEPSPSE